MISRMVHGRMIVAGGSFPFAITLHKWRKEMMQSLLDEFAQGLIKGVRPFGSAFRFFLVALPVLIGLVAAGIGAVLSARLMEGAWAQASLLVGEGLILAAALAGLVVVARGWWVVFEAAGFMKTNQE